MGSLLGWCCFGSAGRPKQEAKRVEKDAPKDGSPPGQTTGAVGCSACQVHASRPATLSSTPQITVQVYNVEQLARLHPRVLVRMPHLLALSSPGAPGPWNAQSAVAGYWQLQEAMESAEDPQLGLLLPWQEMLFLKPVAINSAAGALLGCAPSLSECTRMLAQQLLFQCQAPLQQPTLTSLPESSSLAAVMFEVAAHTLRCTPSLPSAEPSARNPGRIATCSEPHTAIDQLPKEAQCGDGLKARVYAAYCTAPGGSLDPVLILEHSVAKGVITGSLPRDSWLPPPSGSSATSMGESGESPKMVRVSCVDTSLHHYVPPSPHPNDDVFLPRRSSLGATKPRLIAETAHSCQPHTSQPQAEQALGAGFGFSAPESFPGNHQQPAQVQNACPPMQSPKERSLFEETSVQKQHSRALAILNEVPVIATLFNVEGHVVYQNEASLSYWGLLVKQQNSNGGALDRDLVNVSGTCNLSALLEALLPNSPEAIQELLEIVGEGLQWQRVLAVRPPKARSQAEASVTPAAFSQRSRRASIASSNAAGSSGKDRSGWHHADGGINRGNSCGSSADALGGSAAKEPQEQPCSATQQALLQNVQKTQPEWQLHRQQTQPPPKQPGQLHRQQTQPPPKQPGQQRLLRRAVSFASDHFAPGDVKQEEHSKQQDTAFEGDFFCQASMNGDPPFNSNPAPEIQARGLERASTDPGLRIPSILSKNGLPCHSNLGRDSLQDEAASLKHMSLSSSQHVGKHVQDCKLTSTSEDCNATRGDAKGTKANA
ncbi:hypothetical protein DUNSADRAFT_4696 [Dunaliella salina]|uniref:PAS domain-containing protein n=1 Tax=Dunaliella salina TaxID=3046 RepID=A0ABQ7H7I6_DUNSA|nr:hypothetical protein DUNSADRAFT_4696 [Dunaliella salina]|eukprot:KAF5842812.1 hypothetical protein DUNSADRAFT_4696 [Dunaliella salina]